MRCAISILFERTRSYNIFSAYFPYFFSCVFQKHTISILLAIVSVKKKVYEKQQFFFWIEE